MDLYIANPILAIMGYKLFKVSVDNNGDHENILVISRIELSVGDSIDWIPMDNKCWYVKRIKNEYTGNKRNA